MYEEKPRYETRETQSTHQPVVICIDTSASMNQKEEKNTKAMIVEEMLNSLAKMDLSESDKGAIDLCILTFDDECRVLQDWIPLSKFSGEIRLDIGGCTALGSAIIDSIDATRARRHAYNVTGIEARRAQIFLYTDGESTEDMSNAYKYSQEYLNRDSPSAKLYTILIPPANDPTELKGLGDKVAIIHARDCVNGIPKSFKFLKDSIVAWSTSSFGEATSVNIEKDLDVINCQGGIHVNTDGSASVIDTPWTTVTN